MCHLLANFWLNLTCVSYPYSFDCNQGWEHRYDDFSADDWAELQTVYAKPSDIDLFAGGLMQRPQGVVNNTNGELRDQIETGYGLTGKVFNAIKGKNQKLFITKKSVYLYH